MFQSILDKDILNRKIEGCFIDEFYNRINLNLNTDPKHGDIPTTISFYGVMKFSHNNKLIFLSDPKIKDIGSINNQEALLYLSEMTNKSVTDIKINTYNDVSLIIDKIFQLDIFSFNMQNPNLSTRLISYLPHMSILTSEYLISFDTNYCTLREYKEKNKRKSIF